MSNLLLSTLAMMGMTFLIGFFVAGVIKIIANWADFFDFYNTHREEILGIRKSHKLQDSIAPQNDSSTQAEGTCHNRYGKVLHGINETVNSLKPRKRITA